MFLSKLKINRNYTLPRLWSNKELLKFSHLFSGKIINISGASDIDKEGKTYKEYFKNSTEYLISNTVGERGYQNNDKEILLDLTQNIPENLIKNFDVCFNHTTLEHIFEVKKAFENICLMSKDIVILVIPFSQFIHHAQDRSWLDYWRFTPFTIEKLFHKNNFKLLYLNVNDNIFASQYIFAIASKSPEKWKNKHQDFGYINYTCSKNNYNSLLAKIFKWLFNLLKM